MGKNKLNIDISSILEDATFAYEKELGLNKDRIEEINVDMIRPNPYQPRKDFDNQALQELAESIKTYGLLQPIVVMYDEDSIDDESKYILIAGERRLRACKLLGIDLIKAYVGKFSLEKLRELALIENLQRENLNPIELAMSYESILNYYDITHDELSKLVSKSRTHVTNTLRLLNLSDYTKQMIQNGSISQGHAKVIVGLSEDDEKRVVDDIIKLGLSVKDTEKLVRELKCIKTPKPVKKTSLKIYQQDIEQFISVMRKYNIKYKISNEKVEIAHRDLKDLLELFKNTL